MRVVSAIVVNAAAMLLESAPFVLAGAIALRAPWRWSGRAAAYLGCGCGAGPSARSLPAAAAAWITFGPFVAAARLAGALLIECALRKRVCAHAGGSVLTQFAGIWPLAIAGALACALVAMRSGAALLNPKIALALWPCAIVFAYLTFRYRMETCATLRVAPAIMLAGCVFAAPAPVYRATETTLSDAFAGERLDFIGVLTRTRNATALARYAITCCRADAAPVVIRLDSSPTVQHGWAHARGTLVQRSEGLRLRADSIESIPAPADPFVYR